MIDRENQDCQGFYEVSGYTTDDGKKVDSYTRRCWKHGAMNIIDNAIKNNFNQDNNTSQNNYITSNISTHYNDIKYKNFNFSTFDTTDYIKNSTKNVENILKQKTVTDEDIAKINSQNQMTIHNLLDDLEDLSIQKSDLPKIPTTESVQQSQIIENHRKQLRENVYQTIVMLSLSKNALEKNWKKLHIKGSNEEMYDYIHKKEYMEKLGNEADKILKETSEINEKTLNNVRKLREDNNIMRFRPLPPTKQVEQQQKWIWPCKSKIIKSSHGMRMHPIHKKMLNHDGIDIGAQYEKIWAVADGKVIKAKWNGGYGNYIEIDHGNGIISFYGHLNSYNVKAGDYVKQGEVIAVSGDTGWSTAPHLHFGVHKNGNSINPMRFYKN